MLSIDLDMNQLTTRIRPNFHSTILKRGLDYYRQALVRGLQADDSGKLSAKVLGSDIYKVTINLSSFTASTCNCPYGDYCKHMAAVLFEVCKRTGNDPMEFLTPSSLTESKLKGKNSAALTQPTPKQPPISKPRENGTPADWHRYFESQFKNYSLQSVYYVDSMVNDVNRKLRYIAENWQPTLRALYRLHLQLFTMKLADTMYQKLRTVYYYYHDYAAGFSRVSKKFVEQIIQLTDEINQLEEKERYPLHLAQTADYLAEQAFREPDSSCMRWSEVYRLVWWKLLDQKQAAFQERNRLQSLMAKAELTSGIRDILAWAYVHFDIMEERDQAAMVWIGQQVMEVDPGALIGYLQTFLELELGDRLISWLRWLKPYVLRSDREYVQIYLRFWKKALRFQDVEEEWKEIAVSFLPESFYMYAERLFEKGSYQEWVDLCLLMNLTPLEIDSSNLKFIGAEHPRLVLPLYHHAVEQYIQEKNRDSYKRAVKMLKKLHAAYKKLKEQARWEQYIQYLSKQYSRYRAFQEELRKGKLIA
jgi:uncharacterized Zn finger protein